MSCATERAGHARELVKDLVLADWYGIVIVSGDGLVFEVCFCARQYSLCHTLSRITVFLLRQDVVILSFQLFVQVSTEYG